MNITFVWENNHNKFSWETTIPNFHAFHYLPGPSNYHDTTILPLTSILDARFFGIVTDKFLRAKLSNQKGLFWWHCWNSEKKGMQSSLKLKYVHFISLVPQHGYCMITEALCNVHLCKAIQCSFLFTRRSQFSRINSWRTFKYYGSYTWPWQ